LEGDVDPVVVVSASRTPLGKANGKLKSLSSIVLGSIVVQKVTEKIKDRVDSVVMGCVLTAGLGQSPARQTIFGAGLGSNVKSLNINKICGSGMASIMVAINDILAGESSITVAGGMESMTNAPFLLNRAIVKDGTIANHELRDVLVDHMIRDGLMDAYEKCVMGIYAESTASMYAFSRDEQDEYALKSSLKARKATEDGFFSNEIVSVTLPDDASTVIATDEIPFSFDLSKIKTLRTVFDPNGTITAASASSIADGAAAILLMRASTAAALGLEPIARVVAQSSFSQDTKLFATAPIKTIQLLLKKSGWRLADVDLFEINEAFAVVPMAAIRDLGLNPENVNIFGGACSMGHPLGASGARIVVTLLNAMKTRNAKRGVAAICVGGGEGIAMSFELL
jgi:acetyl-CoA C-acetyltransferase